jgi:hypothetical protein
MSRTTHLLTSSLAIAGLCALAVACGSREESSTAAPAASETPATSEAPPTATVQRDSAAARLCIDLVEAKEYAKAIEPCELALQDMPSPEVQRAYDQAKAAVQQAAASAADEAASDALSDPGGE